MTADPVRALIAAASETANRRAARVAWVRATTAAWREAQRAMDQRCCEAVERLSDRSAQPCRGHGEHWREFEALCDEEQAKVDAIRAPLIAVAERDVWPSELYFSGV